MKILAPLLIVIVLAGLAYFGVKDAGLGMLFGVVLPYAAVALFAAGFVVRVFIWARSPVPFRIPTTCGQQKSFPWIKHGRLESPFGMAGVIGRMLLEVLFFRSLFRNTRVDLREGGKLGYTSTLWLWLAGLAFHYTFLIILLRHLRFFTEPVPYLVNLLESLDAFLQVGVPVLYMTDVLFLAAVTYLFLRRAVVPTLSYLSLPADYFPLFLIGGIGVT
jgi:nitrate reductase gamma subunit